MENRRRFATALGLSTLALLFSIGILATNAHPAVGNTTVKRAQTAPRPGYITGRATFADGRSIPNFTVSAESGFAGLGTVQGKNGQYAIRVTDPNVFIVQNIKARATISYQGQTYLLALHPVDGLPDAPSSRKFQGNVKKGVVRNFVLHLSGIWPGYETPAPKPLTTEDSASNRFAFEGCPLKLEFKLDSVAVGSSVQLTLTPNGPLIDGSAGKVIHRTITQLDPVHYYYIYDLPNGVYTATANLIGPDGIAKPLFIKMWVPLTPVTSGDTPLKSVPVRWPFDSKYELINSPMLTFSP